MEFLLNIESNLDNILLYFSFLRITTIRSIIKIDTKKTDVELES